MARYSRPIRSPPASTIQAPVPSTPGCGIRGAHRIARSPTRTPWLLSSAPPVWKGSSPRSRARTPSPGRSTMAPATSTWSVCRAGGIRTSRRRWRISGAERIAEAFESARADGRRAALMPYMMGGFPDLSASLEIGLAYARAGADLIERGVPFSDPLADGPVIHAAGTAALKAGASVGAVVELAGRLTQEGPPVVLMCYSNQIL